MWRYFCLVLVLAGCGAAVDDARWRSSAGPHPAGARKQLPAPAFVLVTIDGARAVDVFDRARLPNLQRLIDRGVALGAADAPMVASGPRFVSLPGYREIVTGRRSAGCVDNDCPPIDEPTLFDELRLRDAPDCRRGRGDRLVGGDQPRGDHRTAVAGAVGRAAWRHHARGARRQPGGARPISSRGARAGAWPGHGDYRPDAWTAALALDVAAARPPRALWVALGDADEYAHRGDRDGYLAALSAADRFLGRLVDLVGLADTIVFVTADHGRAANFRDHGDAPESSAVWLVAAGATIPPSGFVRAQQRYRLADIAPTVRALLHLAADDSPRAGRPITELLAAANPVANVAQASRQ